MKEHYPLRGNVTTILSPFKEDTKEYDFDDLAKEIDLAARAGTAGCLCPSGASEIMTLTDEEKIEMVRVASQAAAGRTLIIPSINKNTAEECAALGEAYLKAGADALNISTGYKAQNKDEYYRIWEEVDKLGAPFVMMQDSGFGSYGMPDDVILDLFEKIPSFRLIKIEIDDNETKYTNLIRKTDARLTVYGGAGTPNTIEGYDRGICGYMPSGLYELFQGLCDLYYEKDREHAIRLFKDMLPIIQFTRTGINHYFHKVYLKRLGIFKSAEMRFKMVPIDKVSQEYCDYFVDYAIELTRRLPEYWED
ncbi:MAG: dihydrodipicolinate synthase family protein [Solobacterium sp.]|nr:dihydrodipicolinate synthase family protein [Solobacterium sp.]